MNNPVKDYEMDGHSIWSRAYADGTEKYEHGHDEHKSKFWTAGAIWYAKNMRSEALDGVAYSHHLISRLKKIIDVAAKLESGDIDGKRGGSQIIALLDAVPAKESK